MMLPRMLTLALTMILATAAVADVPRPDTRVDTLILLDQALRKAAPDRAITLDTGAVALQITLPDGASATISPDNLHINLQAATTADERADILQRFVSSILETMQTVADDPPADMLDRVMPVVRSYDLLNEDVDPTFPQAPFAGGLTVYWVIDSPTSTESFSADDLVRSGLTQQALADRALANLHAYAVDVQRDDLDGVWALRLDGYYEASLMLLPDVWVDIDKQLGTVIAAPVARDVMLYADGDDPEAERMLRIVAAHSFANVPYAISPDVFRWDVDHWTVLP
jgi:uncharacterized protein YtpQ (UPF0354 family)